jgi:hypothetical protein
VSTRSAYVIGLEGEIERDQQGKPKRRPDFLKDTTDVMGRRHHVKLHGKEPQLDSKGFLKVQRRDGGPKPMISGSALDDTLALHKTEGYAYYFVNAKPGRKERMEAHDWEVVQGSEGPVQLKLSDGQKLGAESTMLMRKPLEWYEEDQRAKEDRVIHQLNEKAPKTISTDRYAAGYGEGLREDSGLR